MCTLTPSLSRKRERCKSPVPAGLFHFCYFHTSHLQPTLRPTTCGPMVLWSVSPQLDPRILISHTAFRSGITMGIVMEITLPCWNCGQILTDIPLPISRHTNCDNCYEMLHCCRMCVHLDPSKQGHCADDRADPPSNKENANFCEYFKPDRNAYSPSSSHLQEHAQNQLNAIFDDRSNPPKESGEIDDSSPPDDARTKFNDLFDD